MGGAHLILSMPSAEVREMPQTDASPDVTGRMPVSTGRGGGAKGEAMAGRVRKGRRRGPSPEEDRP